MDSFLGFLRGAGEALAVTGTFLVGGLAAATWLEGPLPADPPDAVSPALYLPGVEPEPPNPRLWLVDGYNAIGVGLLAGQSREGWWRLEHRRALLARVEAFAEPGVEVWVVFDGDRPAESAADGRVREVFAPDADAWLLRQALDGAAVVTADRSLAERARRRGAQVVSPGAFLARCPELS